MNRNRVTVYLTDEAKDCLDWLRDTKTIPSGWLSQRMQRAIVREYKKRTRDL